ncbi:glycoside hydrolase family 43 protein [Luteimonas sp. SJ-92]|uniref:Glycoside hydrolase family 43 protein n=1 Tax=Luteimonas salinisoli TaxID=2752307 RepID=A0A853J8K9_9GAMM|nr:glycoside hydrolase family 43 protein [Luteimonas salinisoli]NZA25112.1 glycoside hydrolase family 43 protein [Luteimonas salinisoli]
MRAARRIAAARALLIAALLLPLCAQARQPVLFDWFEYSGRDAVFETPLPDGHYRNPVLAGFHPDPSITRAGDRYYLVNSSFAYYPGIPVFESADLVHWEQIGHVVDRPDMLDFDGLGVSRGVFAPAIEFHDGTFYLVTTAVDSGGNFVVTATDPAGPWSDPVWLPGIDGIDPSLFFDRDGRVYLLNNGPPEGEPRYDGHRAVWLQAFDLDAMQPTGPRRLLVDGGVDPSTNPIWIEGPHLYRRDGWYYLNCAEGGTGPQHSQVILRSRDVWGPYEPYDRNPILTQRDLPDDRADPVTNAGHADLVQGPDGSWWATFLASRNYDRAHYNTGRETFLLPVQWRDGWPVILEPGRTIPYVAPAPSWMDGAADQAPMTGNFSWRDEFDGPALDGAWRFVRVPKQDWADLQAQPGWLAIQPLAEGLDTLRNPAYLARRQQHLAFEASTALRLPAEPGTEAGLAAFQNERYWYFLGVRRGANAAEAEVFLERSAGDGRELVATAALPPSANGAAATDDRNRAAAHDAAAAAPTATVSLRITGDAGTYGFAFDAGDGWQWLARDQDGTVLSTETAGGFVGATVGPHARLAPDR